MTGGRAAVGYRLTLPEGWFDLELHPRLRAEAARRLVRDRLRDQPELFEQRTAVTRLLTEQAAAAWDAGARFASAFCLPAAGAAITGGLSVSVLPVPPGGIGADLAARFPVVPFTTPDEPWCAVDVVEVDGAGPGVRVTGVEDVRTADGRAVRVAPLQLFARLPSRQLLVVSASSPCVALADDLLELFAAVASTLVVLDGSRESAAAAS